MADLISLSVCASLDARLRAAEVGRETLQASLVKHGAVVESLRGDIGEVVKVEVELGDGSETVELRFLILFSGPARVQDFRFSVVASR